MCCKLVSGIHMVLDSKVLGSKALDSKVLVGMVVGKVLGTLVLDSSCGIHIHSQLKERTLLPYRQPLLRSILFS